MNVQTFAQFISSVVHNRSVMCHRSSPAAVDDDDKIKHELHVYVTLCCAPTQSYSTILTIILDACG